ncbi:protein polybromo-1 isoform X3 [Patella vulgata]|uniref:protein polybromo-1 isoform X3 n=1 Tax=Patella vulgata TaxID=6465 RepID=UPI00218041DA|nr:protein polybromo-1 isoform X3 [Patella vulgata]
MPPKRKRSLAPGSDGRIDEREESPAPQVKRRKKALHYDPVEICQELYDTIRNHKTEDGRLLCEAFIRVPKRRTAADYYEVVTTPIDLLKIQQKLKMEEYEDIEQLTTDVELLINNAKAYYKKNTPESNDAIALLELYQKTKNELLSNAFGDEKTEEKKPEEVMEEDGDDDEDNLNDSKIDDEKPDDEGSVADPDELEALFGSVVTARDDERDISLIFQLLPPKTRYPDYYDVIKDPIDLRTIAQKIQNNEYKTLATLQQDLLLMLKNAKTFNTPKSQIYKDAMTLRKVIITKRQELDHKRQTAKPPTERLNLRYERATREKCPIQKMSAICAALTYPSDDESDTTEVNTSQIDYDSEADTTVSEDENPQWALYNTIRNYQTPDGDLSLPFLKLPNKRIYRDYYEEIKRPISLFQIRKKLKNRLYNSLSELASDMNLMFENAKRYNMAQSRLYKDAVILQKAMMERKRELDKFDVKDMLNEEFDSPRRLERDWDEDSSSSKKHRKSMGGMSGEKKKRSPEEILRRRLNTLFKTVYEYTDVNGRLLRGIFQILPSKKDYPDYYKVIMEPIDLSMIENKIKSEKYTTEQALINDFELMFNNARHYNEEGSMVYQDANTLERVLKAKIRSMTPLTGTPKSGQGKGKPKNRSFSPLDQKLQELYDTVRDATDKSGRELAAPFIKLPLKCDYPDYYEVIKKPIDLQRIQQKLITHSYYSLEDMVADYVQMFDNACKYNEPDSLIYKDALTLQRICLEKKLELTAECGDDVPDVKAVIQEIMTNLFISVYNSQDEEGRCYSDSFAELLDRVDEDKSEERPLTFHQIKGNLDRGRYKRVDRFQEDMFKVFDRARKLSRTDSQLYEDAVEMQMIFIKIRDELCKNGEMLLTPALSFMERHLQLQLEAEKKIKIPLEQKEDEEKKRLQDSEEKEDDTQKLEPSDEVNEEGVKFKDTVYYLGDFVYVEPREHGLEPHILCIEKFVKDGNNIQMIQGNWFYRPGETYHLQTRKFLEKEVFKSDIVTTIAMSQIWGKCHVMFVKDYFKFKPMVMTDKDVYVCESRYSNRHRAFKKIKNWSVPKNEHMKIVPRDEPLTPVRVESVFADKAGSEGKDFDDGETSVLDKKREIVFAEVVVEDGNTYYEQYITDSGACYKLGDSVYINGGKDKPMIARIDKLFSSPEGMYYFSGPWFVRPEEIQHSPTRLFYKREVFLSSIDDTNPMQSIIAKCSVLHIKEYCSSRITEVSENDVYITESKYLEGERSIKKLGKGLKRYSLSPKVTDDEIYFFRKQIMPQKEPSPLLIKASEDTFNISQDAEDSQDAKTETMSVTTNMSIDENSQTPVEKPKKAKSTVRRQPSGYIVYAGEIRKIIQQEHPEANFGDVSRLVGTRWRGLTREEKEVYEERAKVIAAEQVAKQKEADKAFNDSFNRSQSPWSDIGHMSPGSSGRPNTPGSNFQQGFAQPQFGVFPGYAPSPGLPQAGGNFMMQNGSMMAMQGMVYGVSGYPGPRGMPQPGQRMFMNASPPGVAGSLPPNGAGLSPCSYPMLPPSPNSLTNGMSGLPGQPMVPPPPPRPPSPIFVSVPPRTQRLLHSEAYLKYIEGLNAESRTIGDWDKQLTATPENTTIPNAARLPTQWLSQGAGYHGNVTNALWALRNHMLKDTLAVSRTIPFEAL